VANLDPAADTFLYDLTFDVRDLISLEEVMEELGLGPNGGLVYCMEYLLENLDWLHDHLEEFGDDEYLLLDCPGQLELYTHVPVMRRIIDQMRMWGYETSMVAVFCIDATFICDTSKFISGSLLSLSAMIALELPTINVMTKCDLMDEEEVERILDIQSARQLWDMEQERSSLLPLPQQQTVAATASAGAEEDQVSNELQQQHHLDVVGLEEKRRKRHRLTEAICGLLDDWTMVSFVPLNIADEESLDHVLQTVDHAIHYGEDLEVRGAEGDDDFEGADHGER
jgi:GTPase SAR1 family protein